MGASVCVLKKIAILFDNRITRAYYSRPASIAYMKCSYLNNKL